MSKNLIEFKGETRQYFDGEILEDINVLKLPEGIKVFGDIIKFPKKEFKDWAACILKMQETFPDKDPEAVSTKTLEMKRTKGLTLTDEDWETMKTFMPNSERFQKEDFRIYEAWLANSYVDRDGERFRVDVLNSFAKTIVGKSLLKGHDWGDIGEGRYYSARIEKIGVSEAVQIAGPNPAKNFINMLSKIESIDSGIFWLVTKYYILAKNEKLVDGLDSGIISDMSIGFRAPVLKPIKEGSGDVERVLWWEYQNTESREAEALEGSLVFLGSQYGARTRKDASDKKIIETINEVKIMKVKLIGKEYEISVDETAEKQVEEMATTVESEVANLQKAANEATAKLAEVTDLLGKDYMTEIKNLQAEKAAIKAELVKEVIKFGQLSGVIQKESVPSWEKMLEKLAIDELNVQLADYQKIYNEKNPAAGLLEINDNNITEPAKNPNADRAFRAPVI